MFFVTYFTDHVFKFYLVIEYISMSLLLSLNNIPLCRYTIFGLSIHHLVDIWIVSTFGLLIMLVGIFIYRFLYGSMFCFILEICLGVNF